MDAVLDVLRDTLNLGPIGRRFFDFLATYFDFGENHPAEYIRMQLTPWFEFPPPDESNDSLGEHPYSQYFAEWVHQKYRLALEFAATQAGWQNVTVFDSEKLLPASGGLFWFRGCHPGDVYWQMTVGDKVLARGAEAPNTLTKQTLEEWMLTRIAAFTALLKTQGTNNAGENAQSKG